MDSEKRKFGDDDEGQPPPSPKRRVIGPSLPSAESREASGSCSGSDDSDDSDDDFGPSLPPPDGAGAPAVPESAQTENPGPESAKGEKAESRRDQWMLQPPEHSDWASKIDPTQLRNRKFQTGKTARAATASSKTVDASWVETPEERIRRLEDEVMGVGAPSGGAPQSKSEKKNTTKDRSMEEKIKKFNDRSGKNRRLEKPEKTRKEEEDDPSMRAFDREKDMAVSSKISNAQRREMVNKASDYNSRFSKGSFL
ncbi:hypothetical protein N7532_000135 [Penicillium argentinense]|uniref:DUF3752 domain-containing protein n=1 Tax=Penicillium argentinense TaxID=1131581 RepID=A0A9W9G4N6_9EURO|nr:uncharacterized protein N7532_000135 [Penicillium argentinense]KAJ5112090.1 hypothetical protein N7532_000135 [Penicillium argentinense]